MKFLKFPEKGHEFCKTNKKGEMLKFCWKVLPESRFQEFVDFKMEYYVKHEITHVIAGIHENPEAMEEYREILLKQIQMPSALPMICCLDNDKCDNILATNTIKFIGKNELSTSSDVEIEAKTTEVKRFFKILNEWNDLCPVPDVMAKYNLDTYFEDAGLAVHPDYTGLAISGECAVIREQICKENNVPMTGAWLTSIATQKSFRKHGWKTAYEIGYEELENILNVKFIHSPPTFQYKIKQII